MVQKKIVCIGDVVLDILPSILPIAKNEILLDGETFVDSVSYQKGGCAGNFSCVLKSIMPMAEVSLVSRVGRIPYSDFLIKEIEKFGVIPVFQIDNVERTQVTMALSYQDGQRHFLTFLGGLKNFVIEDIPEDIFKDVHHLAFRGIWFAEKLLLKSEEFIKKAIALGVDVSIDLGFDPYWNLQKQNEKFQVNVGKRRSAVMKTLKYVKYLFGNEEEITQLIHSESLDAAIHEILDMGVKNIIIHRGDKGCRIIQSSKLKPMKDFSSINIPALQVEVKNPVGSGDTFDSIFLAEILEGKPIIPAAALATAGAAYSLMNSAGNILSMDVIVEFSSRFPELTPFLNYS
ncbi:carbohydrate kinase family protein [Candidatus Lokiarchaeum ossiferum]